MNRFKVLCQILKILCNILKYCGFFPLQYCRAKQQWLYKKGNFSKYLPTILIFLLFAYAQWLYEQNVIQIDTLESLGADTQPEYEEIRMTKFSIHKLFYGVVPLWSLWRNCELWHIINQAQKTYKHLKNLLGRDFRLECSWTLFGNGLLYIIFIILGIFKTIWLDYPTTKSELPQYRSYKLCNYILDISYCIFFVILALRLYYHILHACLCESLNGLIFKNNQNLIKGLFQALPYLRRMNYFAGFYFNASYICLLLLIWNRFINFLELLKIDDTELLLENRKSLEDMEQEAEWAGQDWQTVDSGSPITKAAITLAWLLGIWILVLSAAGLQQIAHQNFVEKLSNLDFPPNAEELIVGPTAELNIEIWRAKKDILDLKINAGISLDDFYSTSICFYSCKSKVIIYNLDHIMGNCKIFLNVLIFAIVVYIGTEMELFSFKAYIKQESKL